MNGKATVESGKDTAFLKEEDGRRKEEGGIVIF
jgi:hypothetical protein